MKVVIGIFACAAFIELFAIVSAIAELMLFDRVANGALVTDAELIAYDRRRTQLGYAVLGATFFATLALASWMFRYLRNARVLNDASDRYTPFWGTASLFVPIVNLWLPYITILQADRQRTASRLVQYVWPLIGALALMARQGFVFILYPSAKTLAELQGQTLLGIAVLALQVLALYLTGSAIAQLTGKQAEAAAPGSTTTG